MIVGLDFDGVILDRGKLMSAGVRMLYGVEVPPEKCTKEILVGEGYITMMQYSAIYRTREISIFMEPVYGFLHFLHRLLTDGHSVRVITSRDGVALEIAEEWSISQGLKLNFVGVGYGKSKADAATGLDLYVDDDINKLRPLIGVVSYRYLFSWSYNTHADTGEVAERIHSWAELYSTIQRLQILG